MKATVSEDAVLWAANRTLDMHRPPVLGESGRTGRCATCTDEGCTQLAWATTILTTRAADRGNRERAPQG